MIVYLFRGVKWIDAEVHRKLGPSYNVILGIGLVAEIVHRVHEFGEHHYTATFLSGLAIAMFGVLLLHQLAELAEHVERRFRNSHRR